MQRQYKSEAVGEKLNKRSRKVSVRGAREWGSESLRERLDGIPRGGGGERKISVLSKKHAAPVYMMANKTNK